MLYFSESFQIFTMITCNFYNFFLLEEKSKERSFLSILFNFSQKFDFINLKKQ